MCFVQLLDVVLNGRLVGGVLMPSKQSVMFLIFNHSNYIKMTKTEEKNKFKKILNKGSLTEEDKKELRILFKKHPFYNIKKGCGIKDIFVTKTKYGTNGFFIIRNDLSKVDISYLQCVNGASTKLSDIKAACRTSIRLVILNVQNKVNYGIDKCQFTGEILTRKNTHIDHYNLKFNDLFKKWIKGKDVDYLFRQLNDTSIDLVNDIYFENSEIRNDFVNFHNKNTHLRAISKTANLRLG